MSDIFENNTADTNEQQTTVAPTNPLETLVGEGKKYKTIEDLARAKIEADNHIRTIEEENRALREHKETLFELQRQVIQNKSVSVPPAEDPSSEEHEPAPALNSPSSPNGELPDIKALVREQLNQLTAEERKARNVATAQEKMVQLYGSVDKAREAVHAKAAELGVSTQWLLDTAAASPKAFFSALGINPDAPKPSSTNSPSSYQPEVNTLTLGHNQPKPGTWSYYEKLRKEDPKKYMSAAVQNQMMKDAMSKGNAFYE